MIFHFQKIVIFLVVERSMAYAATRSFEYARYPPKTHWRCSFVRSFHSSMDERKEKQGTGLPGGPDVVEKRVWNPCTKGRGSSVCVCV